MIGISLSDISALSGVVYNQQNILVPVKEIISDRILFGLFDNRVLNTTEHVDVSLYSKSIRLQVLERKTKQPVDQTMDDKTLNAKLAEIYSSGYSTTKTNAHTIDIVTKRATLVDRKYEDVIAFVERQFRTYIQTTVGEIPFGQGFGSHIQEYLHTKYTDAAKDMFVAEIKEFAESLNEIYGSFEIKVSDVIISEQPNISVLDVNMNIDISLVISTGGEVFTTELRIS